nr:hypothetical protein [Marinobacter halotolerans]
MTRNFHHGLDSVAGVGAGDVELAGNIGKRSAPVFDEQVEQGGV